ncbi:unnamed protein product [Prorocentrum cordatum]|uniref:Uncharacterized protein n=1 Tax=Prorocentrum cordatum TaxID=2364126 RepID=A0ABN9S0U9_9DINO|nr:unnamed protein product [Polarella glacialis]
MGGAPNVKRPDTIPGCSLNAAASVKLSARGFATGAAAGASRPAARWSSRCNSSGPVGLFARSFCAMLPTLASADGAAWTASPCSRCSLWRKSSQWKLSLVR